MCAGATGKGFQEGWGMLRDVAVVGLVTGCPGLFLAVPANPVLMLQIRSELCRQGPA